MPAVQRLNIERSPNTFKKTRLFETALGEFFLFSHLVFVTTNFFQNSRRKFDRIYRMSRIKKLPKKFL